MAIPGRPPRTDDIGRPRELPFVKDSAPKRTLRFVSTNNLLWVSQTWGRSAPPGGWVGPGGLEGSLCRSVAILAQDR